MWQQQGKHGKAGSSHTLQEFDRMRTKSMALAAGIVALSACEPTVMTMEVGACFDDPESFELVDDVPTTDCAEPHDNEVFASGALTGTEFPGDSIVAERSGDLCLAEFESFIGLDYESSLYDIGWLHPTAESWEVDDREVICFTYHMDFEKITGTLRGIGE